MTTGKVRFRRRRPKIRRQESWRYLRVKESWRRPRGKSSRVRLRRRGWPTMPAVGYRKPRYCRGLHPSGLREKLIHNIKELEGLNPEEDALRIGHTVGARKRAAIIGQAQNLGFKILNMGGVGKPEAPGGGEEPTEAQPATGEVQNNQEVSEADQE